MIFMSFLTFLTFQGEGGGVEVELRKRKRKEKEEKEEGKEEKGGGKGRRKKRERKKKKKEAERREKEEKSSFLFLVPERSTRYSRIWGEGGDEGGIFGIEGGVEGNGRRRRPKKIINDGMENNNPAARSCGTEAILWCKRAATIFGFPVFQD